MRLVRYPPASLGLSAVSAPIPRLCFSRRYDDISAEVTGKRTLAKVLGVMIIDNLFGGGRAVVHDFEHSGRT